MTYYSSYIVLFIACIACAALLKFLLWPKTFRKPKEGEVWTFREDGPWPSSDAWSVRVIDCKGGWVRYCRSDYSPDNRMRLPSFRYCYAPPQDGK